MTRVTLGKSRVREIRPPGSVRAKAKWLSYSTTTQIWIRPEKEKVYEFGKHSNMVRKITDDGSKYLLSLYFAEGGSHVVATSTLDGSTANATPPIEE
ncbi:YopT-type cysteine protease domain-containing protein [Bradyrhizobium uaiense]|uniref:Peptidase C58 YopT-type domain-containing protein n=1 Tax=Bradyrhizobium uaiense TaxID=2594946 RepID=A0A6P1BK33_9BRAD|nr:YopT-type cysteine protease domain-containing protein [Bradyrhizobium uaiense]NEU97912.1 hypothetical protein [Bradyrhizobium uaiense]